MLREEARTEPSSSTAGSSTRELPGEIHGRLLALNALVGWVPSFVANRTRTFALRAAGVQIGKRTIFFGLPTFIGSGNVENRLRVGNDCGFNRGSLFDLEADVTIGDHVAVGHDVMFLTRTYEQGPGAQRAAARRSAPIRIGDGVWLGARSAVMPGVTIGAGSVVGAGVVVTQDLPENTLFVGTQRVSIARWR